MRPRHTPNRTSLADKSGRTPEPPRQSSPRTPTDSWQVDDLPKNLVSFVGAGPGALDLMTLRGMNRLATARVVIWASSLVPEDILGYAPPDAIVHDSASMTLEDVIGVYEAHPLERVVRLHSGDPSLYGAIQEQIAWCEASGRPFEVVPGVSSIAAASALLGRELTLPGISQTVILTRLASRTRASMPEREELASLAASGSTIAVFLSAARPVALQEALLAPPSAYTEDTPAAIVHKASWPDEEVVLTRIGDLATCLERLGATKTTLVLAGDFLRGHGSRSHLYSPGFAHAHRKRSLPGSTRGRPAAANTDRSRDPVPRQSSIHDGNGTEGSRR